jgi:hypothetical protein
MARGVSADELRGLLREALTARLAASGWVAVERPGPADFALPAFARRLDDDFAATATVDMASSIPDRPPVVLTGVTVGVAYRPLNRLWPLLGESVRLDVLAEDARYVGVDDQADDEDDEWSLEVHRPGEVAAAVDALAGLVLDHAGAFAERHASLDALLEAHGAGDPREMDLMVPALLAAAGRFAEARDALGAYPGQVSRYDQRFVRQLERFIDSGGDESLIPDEPPPRAERSPQLSIKEHLREAKLTQEAANAVRTVARARPREEQRAMLEAELARRGLTKSPLWIEQTLDHLWDTPAARRAHAVSGIKALGRLWLGVIKALRGEVPDLSAPEWLEPPVRAAYMHGEYAALDITRDAWVAVSLDPQADDWLQRSYTASAKVADTVLLDAWLDGAPDDPDQATVLAVHLGERRVGTIPAREGEGLMAFHAARDELPCVKARLTPRPPPTGFMLELALPSASGDQAN